MRQAPAFSVVELLVMVSVLALLAGFLLPAIAKAREKSRVTQCTNNLRQWGLAFRMSADDNNDFLPRRGQGVQVLFQIDRAEAWFNALPPYFRLPSFQQLVIASNKPAARSRSVFICLTARDPGETYFLPYGMNLNLSPWFLPRATKFAEVVQPASVVRGTAPACFFSPDRCNLWRLAGIESKGDWVLKDDAVTKWNILHIVGRGAAATAYEFQATTNLATAEWRTLGTVIADAQGMLEFTDATAGQHQQCFYRFSH